MICTAWFDPGVAYKPDPCWRPELLAQEDSETMERGPNRYGPSEGGAPSGPNPPPQTSRDAAGDAVGAPPSPRTTKLDSESSRGEGAANYEFEPDEAAAIRALIREETRMLVETVAELAGAPNPDRPDPGIPARALRHGVLKT